MAESTRFHQNDRRRGVSLIGITALIFAFSTAAFLGAPHLLQRFEEEKAADAILFLQNVHDAQLAYRSTHGSFATNLENLDLERVTPTHFDVGLLRADGRSWALTLTRTGATHGFGQYRIAFDDKGYDRRHSSLPHSFFQ